MYRNFSEALFEVTIQVRDLLESPIRGCPIGAFLVWDLTEYGIDRTTPQEGRRKGVGSRQ